MFSMVLHSVDISVRLVFVMINVFEGLTALLLYFLLEWRIIPDWEFAFADIGQKVSTMWLIRLRILALVLRSRSSC